MRLGFFAIVLTIGACKSATPPTGFGVDLTIDATALTKRSLVTRMSITTSGAEFYSRTLDATKQVQGSGIVRVRYIPGVDKGSLAFTVVALDATGADVSTVSTDLPVVLVPGKAVQVSLALVDPVVEMPDGGDADMLPISCSDGVLDPGEADTDCGGDCAGCEPGRKCTKGSDCATNACVAGTCELATGPPSWVAIASLPAGRAQVGAGALDDGVYVVGGQTTAGVDATTLRYDSASDAWVAAAALDQPRESDPVVAALGRLFVVSGVNAVGTTPTATPTIAAYDPSKAWAAIGATLAAGRSSHAVALGGDAQVYVMGGILYPATAPVATVESFDPSSTAVGPAAVVPALPSARENLAGATDAAGHVLAIGGLGTDMKTATTEVDVFDTGTRMWSAAAALGTARAKHGAALGADGRVYAVGGLDSAGVIANVEALTTSSDHWTATVPLLRARSDLAVTQGWDGRIYAVGGLTTAGPDTSVEAYGPRIVPGPATGAPGKAIALVCSNFAANAKLTITFSGDPPGTIAVAGMSNAVGDASPSLVWKVPAVPAGTYTLTAIDDHARYPVRATFVVQ